MRKQIKTLFVICCALCMLATGLTACKPNKQHTHTLVKTEATSAGCTVDGNNAYWTCSDCGKVYSDEAATKETTVNAQKIPAMGHTWANADCVTPKTCSDCGATDGNALGHTPEADDGDCTTAVKCSVCGDVTTPAKTNHIAHADDNNCLTAVTCTACDTVIVEAKTAHDLSGEWLSDGDGHWHVCKNDGCTVIPDKTEHTPDRDAATNTAPKKCTVCDYIMENQLPHTCSYTVQNKNETHHWMECTCGVIDESTKTAHYAEDDGDCTTALVCECGHTITDAKDHVAGEDDGNCTTAIKCVNCDKDAVAATDGHNDADGDFLCDNCQVTVGNPPEDKNEGIDLPIDKNNG